LSLLNNPNILLKKEEVEYFKGQHFSSSHIFDTSFGLSSEISKDKSITSIQSTQNQYNLNYNIFATKYLKNGYLVEGGLRFSQYRATNNSNLISKQNQNSIYFSISKSLFKNNSKEIISSGQQLAKYNLDISKINYEDTINKAIYDSITMYWDLIYASEKYKLDLKLKKRAQDLVSTISVLIDSDLKPKSDMLQPQANLNSKTISLLNSTQYLINSKENLGLNIGIDIDGIYNDSILDSFPSPNSTDMDILSDKKHFKSLGINNRKDLKVLLLEINKSKLNVKVAQDSLKPDLDLVFGASVTGANKNGNAITSIGNLYDNDIRGNSLFVQLKYELPINNTLAKGSYISSKSLLRSNEIELSHLKRVIESQINNTLNNIKITLLNYKQIEDSIHKYKLFFENEKTKYTMGLSTIMDLIQSEDYLYNEEVKRLNILKTYATQLATLRYVTSDIVKTSNGYLIESDSFLNLDKGIK
jgi:outer membrane protein TolC